MKSKNQEWPEVPEMEKIEEQNPELLAMKIVEAGRQLEASKLKNNDQRREPSRNSAKADRNVSGAPTKGSHYSPSYSPSVSSPSISPNVNSSAFFEDRIKNIITCALNEDNKTQSYPRSHNEPWSSSKTNLNSSSSNAFAGNESENLATNNGEPASKSNLPDYTQVSPAKLALRRHLSQEKVASQSPNFIGTRTIGDLVSGEIERTLEISNQSIINAVVPMCLNSNNTLKNSDFTEAVIQKSLANQYHNRNNNVAKHGDAGSKVNTSPHSSQFNNNAKNSRSSVLYSTNSSSQFVPYAPNYPNAHVPRSEAKSYHDPFFSEIKAAKEEPVEG